jgi:hypothetical protein
MVSNEGRLRVVNRIIHLIFVGIVIWGNPSDAGISFAFICFMWGYDVKERLLLRVKYFSSNISVEVLQRLSWNAIRREVQLTSVNIEKIGILLETQNSKELLKGKGLSLVALNSSLLAGWNGGMYPAVQRGEAPPPGPWIFMLFILKMPLIDTAGSEGSMASIFARTRLPIPSKFINNFCETQLNDFCETLADLGIVDR